MARLRTWEVEARTEIERRVMEVLTIRAHMSTSGLVTDLLDSLGLDLEIKSDPVETGANVLYTTEIPGPRMWRLVGQWRGMSG